MVFAKSHNIAAVACCFILCLLRFTNGDHSFTVTNNCGQTIWVGTQGDNQNPLNGGFQLTAGQSQTFDVTYKWTSGRIWGRTGCDDSGTNCETGDCGAGQCGGSRTTFQPVTLAEFGLDTDFQGMDFYDISLVDGFNVPLSIIPTGGVQQGNKCRQVSCSNFDFGVCPNDPGFQIFGASGNMVACASACSATREGQYCCPSPQYSRDTCQPSDYSRIFKQQCPDAYSYAYDDDTSMFACVPDGSGPSSYTVLFCP